MLLLNSVDDPPRGNRRRDSSVLRDNVRLRAGTPLSRTIYSRHAVRVYQGLAKACVVLDAPAPGLPAG